MKAGVLGSPIQHSLSPILHNAGYQALQLDHHYEAIDTDESSFADVFKTFDEHWMGVSLTMPLKVVAQKVADHVAPLAQLTGSINTLVFTKSVVAYNTDVYGIIQACQESELQGAKTCTIIGSGATARSAIAAAFELGVSHVELIARNSGAIAQCDAIATELGISFRSPAINESNWLDSDLVINTTPAGVADEFTSAITHATGLLLDVVYHPWPTSLARAWEERGGRSCPGYLMLLHQASAQFELFTGQPAPIEEMREAMMIELSKRS